MENLTLEQLVIKEAENIKKHASQEEIDNLNYEYLNGTSYIQCLYGQMTGHCENERSQDLISLCCEKVYNSIEGWKSFEDFYLNGKPTKLEDPSDRTNYYISPIELFLTRHKKSREEECEKCKKLISFIKGEINTLEL